MSAHGGYFSDSKDGSAGNYRCEADVDTREFFSATEWKARNGTRCEGMADARRRVAGVRRALCPEHGGQVKASRVKDAAAGFAQASATDRDAWEADAMRVAMAALTSTDSTGSLLLDTLERRARIGGFERRDYCFDTFVTYYVREAAKSYPAPASEAGIDAEAVLMRATSSAVREPGTAERDALRYGLPGGDALSRAWSADAFGWSGDHADMVCDYVDLQRMAD